MKAEKYLHGLDALTRNNRILGIGLIVMFVWNLANLASLQSAKTHQQVVMVPVSGGTDLWVGDGKASPNYLRSIARLIVGAVGNYTAASIRGQLHELLQFFPADVVGEAQVEFARLADDIERYPSISSIIWLVGKNPIKAKGEIIQVTVLKDRLVNGNKTDSKVSHYCIKYRIDETRFSLLNILEKEGSGEDLCFLDSSKSAS